MKIVVNRGHACTYYCPGCHNHHVMPVDGSGTPNRNWTWNGDRYNPTFSPSILARTNPPEFKSYNPEIPTGICHSYIKDGKIQFLSDCTHELRGQTVPLQDWPDDIVREHYPLEAQYLRPA